MASACRGRAYRPTVDRAYRSFSPPVEQRAVQRRHDLQSPRGAVQNLVALAAFDGEQVPRRHPDHLPCQVYPQLPFQAEEQLQAAVPVHSVEEQIPRKGNGLHPLAAGPLVPQLVIALPFCGHTVPLLLPCGLSFFHK